MTPRQHKLLHRRRRQLRRARKQLRRLIRAAQLRVDRVAALTNRVLRLTARGFDKLVALAERTLDYLERAPTSSNLSSASIPDPASPPARDPKSPDATTVTVPPAGASPLPPANRRPPKPRRRCVVIVEKKRKKKDSARAHGRGKRLATGVDGVRRINVTRELVTGGVNHERTAAFFRNLLVELVFPDVLTRRRRLQEFFGKLLREVVTRARRAAVWIRKKCISMVVATAAWASRLLADLHHRLPSLVPLTNKRKPVRARGNRPRPSSGPSP